MRYLITLFLCVSSISYASDKPLKITKLADNVYQHISYKNIEPLGMIEASGLVVVDGKDAHIIDTPWTQEGTEELIKWISSKNLMVKSSIVLAVLCLLGGGAFGNENEWIFQAIRRAMGRYQHVELDVAFVSYGGSNLGIQELVAWSNS